MSARLCQNNDTDSHLSPIINPQRPTLMIRLQSQRAQILDWPLPFPITSQQASEESTGTSEPTAEFIVFRIRGINILTTFNRRFVF